MKSNSGTAKLENSHNRQRYNRYNVSLSVQFNTSSYDLAICKFSLMQPSKIYIPLSLSKAMISLLMESRG